MERWSAEVKRDPRRGPRGDPRLPDAGRRSSPVASEQLRRRPRRGGRDVERDQQLGRRMEEARADPAQPAGRAGIPHPHPRSQPAPGVRTGPGDRVAVGADSRLPIDGRRALAAVRALARGPGDLATLAARVRGRVEIRIAVERVVVWPDLACAGEATCFGARLPAEPPAGQRPPANGTGPRVDQLRAADGAARLPHRLLGWIGADGFPVVVPVDVLGADDGGILLRLPGARRPRGRGGRA